MAKRTMPPEWYASQAARRKARKEGSSTTASKAPAAKSVTSPGQKDRLRAFQKSFKSKVDKSPAMKKAQAQLYKNAKEIAKAKAMGKSLDKQMDRAILRDK